MASVGQIEEKNDSNLFFSSSRLPQVSQGEYRGTPQLKSTLGFSYQQERCLVSIGDNPEVLNDAGQAFLMNHIRNGTRGTYQSGCCWF